VECVFLSKNITSENRGDFFSRKAARKTVTNAKSCTALSGSVSTRIFFDISMMLGWLGLAGLTL